MKGEQDGYKKVKQDSYKKNIYKKGKQTNGNDGANANGNTITAQINKQKASVSGFDNTAEQEAQNLICTHPSATCVSEGSETNSTDTTDGDGGGSGQGNGTGD